MSTDAALPRRLKLVIVGDGAAGKTSLLIVFTSGHFPVNHIPTVFDNHLVDVFLDNQVIQLALWDTAGQEDYARLRPLSYPGTDCLLVCFAIDNPSSLENVESQWRRELEHYCPRVPFLLIGCKTDLRQDPDTIATLAAQGRTPITYQQGSAMASKIKAWRYLECSAKLNEGVSDVFEFATRAAAWGNQANTPTTSQSTRSGPSPAPPSKPKKPKCVLM